MKAMSFCHTKEQYRRRQKIVSRRGNCTIRPGEDFNAVEKMQGLKKGEHRVSLGISLLYSDTLERVDAIIIKPIRQVPYEIFPYAQLCCRYRWLGFCKKESTLHRCDPENCPGIHEVDLEGFPNMPEEEFVAMLMKINHARRWIHQTVIHRVCFLQKGA